MATDRPNPLNTQSRTMSHQGRGGAGNVKTQPTAAAGAGGGHQAAEDLSTPTLKSSFYTTGRGGAFNMAKNDPSNPQEARAAQDVDAPKHHDKEMKGIYSFGRGGEGNKVTVSGDGKEPVRGTSKERKERTGSFNAALNKGREMLGLKGKAGEKKNNNNSSSSNEAVAVDD